ncbi:hypothetical protein GCM10011297_17840 [Bacterioplanes sanyensis]|nr:hypothetical protein GCM10011297_17840 [Bacterioplanes sanyensis]
MRLRRRQWLAVACLVLALLAMAVTKQLYWPLLCVPVLLRLGCRRAVSPLHLGCDGQRWWWQHNGQQYEFFIRPGSVRRADQVKLQYGHWPWQYWLLLADQFRSDEDFRQLRRCLYRDF